MRRCGPRVGSRLIGITIRPRVLVLAAIALAGACGGGQAPQVSSTGAPGLTPSLSPGCFQMSSPPERLPGLALPPNSKVAFVCGGAVYVGDSAGSTRITQGPNDSSPTWSPDGRSIAFDGRSGSSNREVYVVGADGTGLFQVTREGVNDSPTWSADGTQLAFEGSVNDLPAKVFVATRDGSRITRITPVFKDRTWDRTPAWSPDGEAIAFVRESVTPPSPGCPAPCPAQPRSELHIVKPDGSGDRLLTTDPQLGEVAWSPDGKMIAFRAHVGSHDQISVIRADGTNRRQVTQSAEDHYGPNWAGDDDHLLFWTGSVAAPRMYLYDLAAGSQTLLGDGIHPTWWASR